MSEISDTLTEYNLAREIFKDWCHSTFNNAIPIEFGKVKCPGLSDLDLGLVFNSEIRNHPRIKEKQAIKFITRHTGEITYD